MMVTFGVQEEQFRVIIAKINLSNVDSSHLTYGNCEVIQHDHQKLNLKIFGNSLSFEFGHLMLVKIYVLFGLLIGINLMNESIVGVHSFYVKHKTV